MIKETLIFRIALLFSALIHVGGLGLWKGDNNFINMNGFGTVKDNIIVFEIGWIIDNKEEPAPKQEEIIKINKVKEQKEEFKKKPLPKQVSTFLSKQGSSGNVTENRGGVPNEYLQRVRKCIESAKFYPRAARRRGMEGIVTVSFNIDGGGNTVDIRIIKSSGFSILDNATREIVLEANPFPKPPKGSIGKDIQTTIVFEL